MDKRREAFKQYLENSGLMDHLSNIIVKMYEANEKPTDPLKEIRAYFSKLDGVDIDELRATNQKLRETLDELMRPKE